MIVKDCAEELERCLKSVQDYCDILSITDTGSIDNTLEVAKDFNAIISHYKVPNGWKHPFIDHFANARNISEKNVPKDCLFSGFIDSDDELFGGELLRASVLENQTGIKSFTVAYKNDSFAPVRHRIWTRGYFTWIRRIHEEIFPIYEAQEQYSEHSLVTLRDRVFVLHHKSDDTRNHVDRDLILLDLDFQEEPTPQSIYQLACHIIASKKETDYRRAGWLLLQIINNFPEAREYCLKAHYKLSVLALMQREFLEANGRAFKTLEYLHKNHHLLDRRETDRDRLLRYNLFRILGKSFEATGDKSLSENYYNKIPMNIRNQIKGSQFRESRVDNR